MSVQRSAEPTVKDLQDVTIANNAADGHSLDAVMGGIKVFVLVNDNVLRGAH